MRGAFLSGVAALALGIPAGAAPAKVQFSRQVLPVLTAECRGCHMGSAAPGGYTMESAEKLAAGGRHGAAVVPGKSASSTLVKYLTGEIKPQMPPGKPLPLDKVALIRRWIDEGAKIDSMTLAAPSGGGGILRGAMPVKADAQPAARPLGAPHSGSLLPAPVSQSAPVTAVAYSPDGKLLAAGGYRAVRLLDPATGSVLHILKGPVDQVLSLCWSPDGKWLAAAGGLPGVYGEVCVWQSSGTAGPWGAARTLKDHTDAISSIAWRPGAAEFATASLDKTVRIWDAEKGVGVRTLKDHVDAVFGVAYSPDGKWMATASGDRTVKLYQADTRAKVSSLGHGDAVLAVAFSGKSDLLVTACADKQVRVWPVKAGTVENPTRGHGEGEAVDALAFSADGSTFAWGAINRKVRIWNGEVSGQKRELNEAPDWVYAVALSPDGKRVAAGVGDGRVYFWNTDDGKLERSVALGAGASAVAAGTVPEGRR